MSQPRNTLFPSLRPRYTAGAALVLAGLAACSSDQVTGPRDAAAAAEPAFATGTSAPITVVPTTLSTKDAAKRLSDAAITQLAGTWRTTSADVELPTTAPLDLTCAVQGVFVVRQRVGRSGGTLKFGKSELRIPSGALAADTDISATISLGRGVNVEFAPHGLKFARAAELRVDWTGCTQPAGSPINLYYLDASRRITQVMPSSKTSATTARMLTDHFSGFTVSWGRRGA